VPVSVCLCVCLSPSACVCVSSLKEWTLEPETLVAVYAIAKLRNGGEIIEVVPGGVIEQLCVDQLAKHGGKGVWREHFGAQARKTAIRRISNHLPKSAEDSARQWYEALEHERRTEVGQVTDAVVLPESAEMSQPFVDADKAFETDEPVATEETAESLALTIYYAQEGKMLSIYGSDASLASIRHVLTRKTNGLDALYKPRMEEGKLIEVIYLAKGTPKNLALLVKACGEAKIKLVEEIPHLGATDIGFSKRPDEK